MIALKEDQVLILVNQLSEMEKKMNLKSDSSLQRSFQRIKTLLSDAGIVYSIPMGEAFNETRTDCEASIAGDSINQLQITEVIKPIVWRKEGSSLSLIQKGIVIVSGK
ncbi:MAG: hypothetical protein MUF42_14710 [Cytophagaceae bacterium]|jgi:hypothetical protein|nr:hypothetical protein [Cytophagaceae bacterium]